MDAVRALFAAAVQRAAEARWRRDSMEDCCNEEAAKNQKAASELATRRATASRAKVRDHEAGPCSMVHLSLSCL